MSEASDGRRAFNKLEQSEALRRELARTGYVYVSFIEPESTELSDPVKLGFAIEIDSIRSVRLDLQGRDIWHKNTLVGRLRHA